MVHEPVVFDIQKCDLYVDNTVVDDLASDGFGITPEAENTLIQGLTGELGFNIDPSDAVTIVVTVKSSSPSHTVLNTLYKTQKAGGTPVKVEVIVDDEFKDAFGFKRRGALYAVIQKAVPFETDGKEAPDMEYTFIGYGYFDEST